MRIGRGVLGGLLIMIGAVWFLQSMNVLPGSFMTGQTRWRCTAGLRRRKWYYYGRRNGDRGLNQLWWRGGIPVGPDVLML